MKIGQYCQRQRCRHDELEQFWQAFASRGFVSDSWAFLFSILFANQIPAYTTFFHLPATLLSFPAYVLPHLSLVQSHEPKSFNYFLISLSIITNLLFKYHPGFLIVIIVLLLLLSLSLIALFHIVYPTVICYSAIRLPSRKGEINSVSVYSLLPCIANLS